MSRQKKSAGESGGEGKKKNWGASTRKKKGGNEGKNGLGGECKEEKKERTKWFTRRSPK